MAQSWRSRRTDPDARRARPLDAPGLERIALRYVERYATTRVKLADYLSRKLRERGWAGEGTAQVESLVEAIAALGYVDDAAFANARAASLARRGYGPRRVTMSLKAAGIGPEDAADAEAQAQQEAWTAALAFSRRKKIGPFAPVAADRAAREKAFAALLRAGHDVAVARRIVQSDPGDVPELD